MNKYDPKLISHSIFVYDVVSSLEEYTRTGCIVFYNCKLLFRPDIFIYNQITYDSCKDVYRIENKNGDEIERFKLNEIENNYLDCCGKRQRIF